MEIFPKIENKFPPIEEDDVHEVCVDAQLAGVDFEHPIEVDGVEEEGTEDNAKDLFKL